MPSISDVAVCLRRWDFSETSQTVCLFTREHGVLRGLAKGAKRGRGSFSGGFDVLTRGHVVAIVKPGRDLATLTEWQLQQTFRVLRERLDANRAGLYMGDLVAHLLHEHDPHPRLFDALVAGLTALDAPGSVGLALLRLQWIALEEAGYRPSVDRDAESGGPLPAEAAILAFSPEEGGFVADADRPGAWRTRRETADLLRALALGSALGDAEEEVVDRANRLLAAYGRVVAGREIPAGRWAFGEERPQDRHHPTDRS